MDTHLLSRQWDLLLTSMTYSLSPYQVTAGKDQSLVLLLSLQLMISNMNYSELFHELLQSQDIRNHCVVGWE